MIDEAEGGIMGIILEKMAHPFCARFAAHPLENIDY
jgi:hypothetical protein